MKKKQKPKKLGFFLKWKLYIKGKIDARNEIAKPSSIEGKYHTPYLDMNMAEFSHIENEKFTDIIEERIKELNQSIINLNHQRSDIILNTKAEIHTLNLEINTLKEKKSLTTSEIAKIKAKEDKINEIKRKSRNKINEINRHGIANRGEADELIKNFNADFYEELSFCRKKLAKYWDSFFTKCTKINPNTTINGQLPSEDELLIMYNIKNPSSGFKIETFDANNLDNFEINNE